MICRPSLVPKMTAAGCALVAAAVFSLAGCSTEDPQLKSLRDQFLLRSEPKQPTTIADAKAKVAENPRVKFVGQISSDVQEAFTPGKASFLLIEILADDHGHGSKQEADDCPFCKRRAANAPRAGVQFVDAAGETLAVDARELFGINPGDRVVVQGKGELMGESDLFIVTADGVYVRPQEID